ncbi:Retrovirus-related Pol polyprotein from transposon RE2 [Glycine soja]|uniref:Retrovirus-related Pol polyprotein from transposon RE2 n=1 Tax=Glycine soja TaxID=3848 RepID=A0A445I5H3_GLYSO|nr:Retrovirus-related Pol polyprotein from transposon RE2 [Glycine soja]
MADNNSFILNPHEPSKPLACITFTNVTKLLPNNYPNWKQQVEALLDGYHLLQYPDGSFPAPSEMILTAPTSSTSTPSETTPTTASLPVTTQNPAYQTWRRQDRLIYGALLTTLSNEVASLVSQTKTSHDLWILLKNTYAKASRKPFLGRCLNITHSGTLLLNDLSLSNALRVTQPIKAHVWMDSISGPPPHPPSTRSSDCFSLGWPIRNDGEFFKSTSDLAQGRKGAAARKSGNQILLRHEHSGTSSAALTICGHFLYWVCRYLGPDPELSRLSSMEIH